MHFLIISFGEILIGQRKFVCINMIIYGKYLNESKNESLESGDFF